MISITLHQIAAHPENYSLSERGQSYLHEKIEQKNFILKSVAVTVGIAIVMFAFVALAHYVGGIDFGTKGNLGAWGWVWSIGCVIGSFSALSAVGSTIVAAGTCVEFYLMPLSMRQRVNILQEAALPQ